MKDTKRKRQHPHRFYKVAPCLYRYSPNGIYYARINSRGKEITHSLRTSDFALARRKLSELKNVRSRLDPGAGRIVLATLVEKYRATFAHQKRKTQEYKLIVTRRVRDEWPTGSLATPITRIRPSDCVAWLAQYDFGSEARNRHIAVLKALFGMAVHDRALAESPAEHLKKVRVAKPIRITPTFEQFAAIIASVRAQKFNGHGAEESADFLEFLGLAGLGQAEAGALRRMDVDLKAGRIVTFRHKTSTGFVIPLYPQVRPLLEKVCEGKKHDEHLFRPKDPKKALAAACDRLNLPRFSQRSLRRMFIVRALERGVDPKTVSEWQGHADGGSLILKTYSHVRPVHSQRMAQLMSNDLDDEIPLELDERRKQLT
jgi:integrase